MLSAPSSVLQDFPIADFGSDFILKGLFQNQVSSAPVGPTPFETTGRRQLKDSLG